MGIQGFLPLLKSIMVPINIKDLKGCSVAVDTYSWLHKGALSCSTELCKGIPTTRSLPFYPLPYCYFIGVFLDSLFGESQLVKVRSFEMGLTAYKLGVLFN